MGRYKGYEPFDNKVRNDEGNNEPNKQSKNLICCQQEPILKVQK